jgi:hypothetical protein
MISTAAIPAPGIPVLIMISLECFKPDLCPKLYALFSADMRYMPSQPRHVIGTVMCLHLYEFVCRKCCDTDAGTGHSLSTEDRYVLGHGSCSGFVDSSALPRG